MGGIDLAAVQRAFDLCTWGNTQDTPADWFTWLGGEDEGAKKRLFRRVFLEAPDGKTIKALFSEEQIRSYLGDFAKPLPRIHLERRRRVWRFLYLGERVPIPELDWTIGT